MSLCKNVTGDWVLLRNQTPASSEQLGPQRSKRTGDLVLLTVILT